ncbi:hypothetical protein EMIHUDRAFT_62039 [Emiliania huxleyi CCMP1516]|uniref:Tyrosine specific protein phosphatases domain-containing protein n=2 Tax=Emiliania huxleyi TaxID=2903 RepID=A0A0D3IDP5_EMIH1|nr:hypothetical protein EMIHUDRAFT_62039 [Emiliania huxleyi CCMP1516]EOD09380.1 hypothetical protein EMIHUDRAFT_62039 [Emiliania huxleyi CCMP1516]|eukprot:XP_005761809.1 hypothetical protein EMIHUDRAFT_62039 [Emiliania huxleyi CCMP1516]
MAEAQLPPPNFAVVWSGVFRSAFPVQKNFGFLKQRGLRSARPCPAAASVVYLCPEEYPETHLRFLEAEGIALHQFGMTGSRWNKDLDEMPEEVIQRALDVVLDCANHPVLIHCNQGHRTGCLVGCLRRMQRWRVAAVPHGDATRGACSHRLCGSRSMIAIFDEYRRFAADKARRPHRAHVENR